MKKSILFILILIVFCFSCSRRVDNHAIKLPPTPVISHSSGWAVVISNYVRIRSNPEAGSEVIKGLTKGTPVEIIFITKKEETIQDITSYWYQIQIDDIKGWLFGGYLKMFSTREEAEKYSEEL